MIFGLVGSASSFENYWCGGGGGGGGAPRPVPHPSLTLQKCVIGEKISNKAAGAVFSVWQERT